MTENLSPALVLGTVVETRVDGPGPQARLQRLDRAPGTETDWLAIAAPMAGPDAGFSFVPEPGDLAVAAFHGTTPIILGFVFGGGTSAPSEDPVERLIRSRDGNALLLIDGEKSGITLRDQHGNEIRMDRDGIAITTAKDLTLTATGTTTIKGATVELNP